MYASFKVQNLTNFQGEAYCYDCTLLSVVCNQGAKGILLCIQAHFMIVLCVLDKFLNKYSNHYIVYIACCR